MRSIPVVAVLCVVGCVDRLDDFWSGACTPDGTEPIAISATLEHRGGELGGEATVSWLGDTSIGPLSGTVDGDVVAFQVDLDGPLTVDGTLDVRRESIVGTCTAHTGDTGPVTLFSQRARE